MDAEDGTWGGARSENADGGGGRMHARIMDTDTHGEIDEYKVGRSIEQDRAARRDKIANNITEEQRKRKEGGRRDGHQSEKGGVGFCVFEMASRNRKAKRGWHSGGEWARQAEAQCLPPGLTSASTAVPSSTATISSTAVSSGASATVRWAVAATI